MKGKMIFCAAIIILAVTVGCGQKENKSSENNRTKQEETAKELRKGDFVPSPTKTW